jgi:adenine-specific DNA-methyltransferase
VESAARSTFGRPEIPATAPGRAYIVDYYCAEAKLVVELDGISHLGRAEHDEGRTLYLNERGLYVLRLTNDELLKHREAVAEAILEVANQRILHR